jgi:flavodoxin
MKTLVIYYSFTNNNRVLATHLKENFGFELFEILETNKRTGMSIMLDLVFKRKSRLRNYDLAWAKYNHVIFVSPVWAGKIATPLKTFLLKEKANIPSYSFVTLCGGTAGQREKISNDFTTLMGRAPEQVVELWINDLLPQDKKDTIKYTSGYRIQPLELSKFAEKLRVLKSNVGVVKDEKQPEKKTVSLS